MPLRTAALDLGNKWTGVALSDVLGITARPYHTVATSDLIKWLPIFITEQEVSTIVVGLPKTLKGTESEQTVLVRNFTQVLQKEFPTINWCFWDERLSSKQATSIQKMNSSTNKMQNHAIAAAIFLTSYLMRQEYRKSSEE